MERKPYYDEEYTTPANIATTASSTHQVIPDDDMSGNAPFDTIVLDNKTKGDNDMEVELDNKIKRTIVKGALSEFNNLNFQQVTKITNLGGDLHTAGNFIFRVMNTKHPRRL